MSVRIFQSGSSRQSVEWESLPIIQPKPVARPVRVPLMLAVFMAGLAIGTMF